MTGVDPPDTITWTFDGMEIFSGNESTGGNFTLTISRSGYGMYTCTSSNEFGTNNDTVEVIRAGINFLHELLYMPLFIINIEQY